MTRRQTIALLIMAVLAGCALGWSLRQIRASREALEAPAEPVVHLRMDYPSSDIPVREVPGGIQFTF